VFSACKAIIDKIFILINKTTNEGKLTVQQKEINKTCRKGKTVQHKGKVITLLFQDKMQLTRQFFAQEYGIFLVCVLLFLSNTTRGNSSNDPTGFPNEGIDYFPLDSPHNHISATPKFILFKDNSRTGKTNSFHVQKSSSDNSMPYHSNLPSGNAQYNNYFIPETTKNLRDAANHKENLNRDIWEMTPFFII